MPADAVIETDVVIAGGGPAGMVLEPLPIAADWKEVLNKTGGS